MSDAPRAALRRTLAAWMSPRMPRASGLEVTGLHAPSAGSSAETILFDVRSRQDGQIRRDHFVLRRQLEGVDLFLNPKLDFQCAVLDGLAGRPGAPVPRVIGLEMDRAILGSPFYVMEKMEGRNIPQFPNYNREGWLADLPEPGRREVWFNAIDAIAAIHRVDWRDGLAFMSDPDRGDPGLDQYLNFVEEWFVWAAAGREQPTADAALAYLKANKPEAAPASLLWGDATPANMLFAPDNSVSAVLDWEMAALGPGEVDLAWWLFFDHLFSEGWNVPRLQGLPTRQEMVARYEAAAGRTVGNLDYYEILAMLRLGIVTLRNFDRKVIDGALSPDSLAYRNNPIQSMIARKLGLPDPGIDADFAGLHP